MLLAMSSPTAILWFATVGGALISRMGQHSISTSSMFLAGFFIAGIFWTCVLCLVGSFRHVEQGKKPAAQRKVRLLD